jgi:hypothetical protein
MNAHPNVVSSRLGGELLLERLRALEERLADLPCHRVV